MEFETLLKKKWLHKQLESIGLKKPTPIQTNCIPAILERKQNCIGCAKTGSGKTMAFALPILHTLSDDPYGIYALVLTPTRELAFQIADQFRAIGKPIGLRDVVVVGGRDMVLQGQELASRPHIVIATPGRLADHLQSCNTFSLKKIKYLVLDEADRLLEPGGFDDQLKVIFDQLPAQKQTLLFSATFSNNVEEFITKTAMAEAPFVWREKAIDESQTVSSLAQYYILTPVDSRDAYLVHIVQNFTANDPSSLIMVFAKTCKSAQLLSMTLTRLGFPCEALHSMRTQKERMKALSAFRSHQVKILVATDVASRGLDIPEVQLVINHNVPSVTTNYIHRVGRTARAGRKGQTLTMITPTDVDLVHAIEEMTRVKMQEYPKANIDDAVADIHVQVSVTKREQEIKLKELDYDEKRNIHKRKKLLMKGLDPDEVEMEKKKAWKKKRKMHQKERQNQFKNANKCE